jgi:hypothetical protein
MNQTFTPQHLSPDAITQLVKHLPDYIKVALLEKSTELECSLEATIEMAHSPKAKSLRVRQFLR